MFSMPEAVGAASFEMLVSLAAKGVVLLAAAIALSVALRRASAALRHQIWSLALLGLLGLPAISLAMPSWEIAGLPFYSTSIAHDKPSQAVSIDAGIAHDVSAPVAEGLRPRAGGKTSTAAQPAAVDHQAKAPAPSTDAALEPAAVEPGSYAHLFTWALAIWLAGALVVLARLLTGTAAVWWMTKRAEVITDREWLTLAKELSSRLGLNRSAVLLLSKQVTMPLTCGLFRAAVLLPADAAEWTDERRRIVLLHELAHVKRRDCLIQSLAHLSCAMHWFNPLIWISVHRMRIDREMACDDHVLHTGTKATDYAGHLLDIARRFRSARCPSFAAVAIARRSQLEGRLLAILDPGLSRRGLNRAASALIAFVAVGVIVALSVLQPASAGRGKAFAREGCRAGSIPGEEMRPGRKSRSRPA